MSLKLWSSAIPSSPRSDAELTARSSTTSGAAPFLMRLTWPVDFSSTRKSWSLRNSIWTGCVSPDTTVRTSSFGSTTDGRRRLRRRLPANTSAPATAVARTTALIPTSRFVQRPPIVSPTHGLARVVRCNTPAMLERRTKIVATLGPATDADGVLDRLVAAGLDCARLNCSHGGAEDLSNTNRRQQKKKKRIALYCS